MSMLAVRIDDGEYTALSDIRYNAFESDLIRTLKNRSDQMIICPRVLVYNDNLEIVGALLPYVVDEAWSVCFTSFKSTLFWNNVGKLCTLDSTMGVRYRNNGIEFTNGHILVAVYYSADAKFSYLASSFKTLGANIVHLLFIDLRSGKFTVLDDAINVLKSGTISFMLDAHQSEFMNAKFENDKFIVTLANFSSGVKGIPMEFPVTSLEGCDVEVEAAKVIGLDVSSFPKDNFTDDDRLFYNVKFPENPPEDKFVIPDISFPARLTLFSDHVRLPKSVYLSAFSEAGLLDLSSFECNDDVQIFLSKDTKCSFRISSIHTYPRISLFRKEPTEYDCLAGVDVRNKLDFPHLDWKLKAESIGSMHLDIEGAIPFLDFRYIKEVTGSIRGIIGHAYFKTCSDMNLNFADMLFSSAEFEACALRDVKSLRFAHSLLLSKCSSLTKDDYVNLGDGNYGYLKLVLSGTSIAVRSSGAVLSNLDIIGDETEKVRINGVFQVREVNLSCLVASESNIVLIKPCKLITALSTSCISCLTIKGLPVAAGIGYVLSWDVPTKTTLFDNIRNCVYDEFTWILDLADHSDECIAVNFVVNAGAFDSEMLDDIYTALYLLSCVNVVHRPSQRVLFSICITESASTSISVGNSEEDISFRGVKESIATLDLTNGNIISYCAGLKALNVAWRQSFAADLSHEENEALLLACRGNFERQGIDLNIAISLGLDYLTPQNNDVQFNETALTTSCRTIYT